jgi:hypothetical protein
MAKLTEREAAIKAVEGAAIALRYADGYYRDEYAKLIAGLEKAAELLRRDKILTELR